MQALSMVGLVPKYIMCPRCNGTGEIHVKHKPTVITEKSFMMTGDCPRCRGTGQASLFEKMGEKKREHREEG